MGLARNAVPITRSKTIAKGFGRFIQRLLSFAVQETKRSPGKSRGQGTLLAVVFAYLN